MLSQVLTAFHDPRNASQMLVSARESDGSPRRLFEVARPTPRIVRRNTITGHRSDCVDWPYLRPPVHGQVHDNNEHYAVPPDWRWSLPFDLPTEIPLWLRCTLFFSWDDGFVVAAHECHSATTHVYHSHREAFDAMPTTDILIVCTATAQEAVEAERARLGWRAFVETLPVVCMCDSFARTASLDRTHDGSASWYRAPFLFEPRRLCHLSPLRCQQLVHALVIHRASWISSRGVVSTMFALSSLTRLPLHEIAVAQQTMLADALVEWVWMRDPLALDAPRPVHGDPSDQELERFKGASVLNAKTGLHRCTVLFPDVRSLYPSVVLEYMQEEYPLMAELFRLMIELRASERDPVRAASLKVITSSRYGTLKYGRYRNVALAERITEAGRQVQAESLAALEASGLQGIEVIAGDTDSLAIALTGQEDTPEFRAHLVDLLNGARRYSLYKSSIDCFSRVFFINNKSWAGVRSGDGEIVSRGFPQNRSVTPRFLLESHHEWTRLVLLSAPSEFDEARRRVWIDTRAAELRQNGVPLADLVVWPKPDAKHPDANRGYLVVKPGREHIAYADYMRLGESKRPVDVDYLVKIYFVDELMRHSQVLG